MRTTPIRRAGSVFVLSLLVALGACSDDGESAETDETDETEATTGEGTEEPTDTTEAAEGEGGAPGDAVITIQGFEYNDLTVAPGTEVTVTNLDGAPHSVTAVNGEFDSGRLSGDQSGSIAAPDSPGAYEYICNVHGESMSGTLTVE